MLWEGKKSKENEEEHKHDESIMEKIAEKIHGHHDSSSSDSDEDKKFVVYKVFRGGKPCVLSFLFGVISENKKFSPLPASGTPISGKGVVICKYPSDPIVALGYLSVAFLLACTVAGYKALLLSYKGKSVPNSVLFKSTSFSVFFNIVLITSGLALSMLLWPTITEQLHWTRNVHQNLKTSYPTAKTGLLGGGAIMSSDSCLLLLLLAMS